MLSEYFISSLLHSLIAKWRKKCYRRGKRLSALKICSSAGQYIVWLRFVDFKYHLPLPNPDQPSLWEKLQIPEQIHLFLLVSLPGFSGTWWETCFSYSCYCDLPDSQQRREGIDIIPSFPLDPSLTLSPRKYVLAVQACVLSDVISFRAGALK